MRDLAIVGTASGRIQYLLPTLESWDVNKGIHDVHRMWFIEPTKLAEREQRLLGRFGIQSMVNSFVLGPLGNPWKALNYAFKRDYPFVILAEDDSTVQPDTLDYFQWAADKFRYHEQVMFVCAFQKHARDKDETKLRAAEWVPDFAPTVWGTWIDRWVNHLRDTWDHDYTYKGWDWNFTRNILPSLGAGSIVPMYSRSQHIGEFGGAHCTPEMFHDLQAPVEVWEHRPDQPWRMVEV